MIITRILQPTFFLTLICKFLLISHPPSFYRRKSFFPGVARFFKTVRKKLLFKAITSASASFIFKRPGRRGTQKAHDINWEIHDVGSELQHPNCCHGLVLLTSSTSCMSEKADKQVCMQLRARRGEARDESGNANIIKNRSVSFQTKHLKAITNLCFQFCFDFSNDVEYQVFRTRYVQWKKQLLRMFGPKLIELIWYIHYDLQKVTRCGAFFGGDNPEIFRTWHEQRVRENIVGGFWRFYLFLNSLKMIFLVHINRISLCQLGSLQRCITHSDLSVQTKYLCAWSLWNWHAYNLFWIWNNLSWYLTGV